MRRRSRRSAAPFDAYDLPRSVEDLIDSAVYAIRRGQKLLVDRMLAVLEHSPPTGEVQEALAGRLTDGLAALWERGWQPADVVRLCRRRLGKSAGEVAAAAVVEQSRTYAQWGRAVAPEWMIQVDRLAAEAEVEVPWPIQAAIEVLALIGTLPSLPELMAPPSAWPHLEHPMADTTDVNLDPGLLERIRALLAKAESTEFDAEAEALTAKAQELMTRHRIDQAALASEKKHPQQVTGRRVAIDDPYARQKFVLLSKIAFANGCRAAWSQGFGFATVFGHPHDITGVDELFTSLLVQATRAMQRQRPPHLRGNGSETARFRRSFLVGFAHRIGQRLAAASDEAVTEAQTETGVALVPLLAARERAAEQAMESTLGRIGTMSVSATDGVGYLLGREAADSADLRIAGGAKLPR